MFIKKAIPIIAITENSIGSLTFPSPISLLNKKRAVIIVFNVGPVSFFSHTQCGKISSEKFFFGRSIQRTQ